MLIISLIKGVPARTTQVITAGGILKRAEMDLVMNPHDEKALQAGDYLKRLLGGKLIALTMGPDAKLRPIMRNLFKADVEGIDEAVILSDRRMAGADTLATAYTIALGIKKVLKLNEGAFDALLEALGEGKEEVLRRARELYHQNLIPHSIYSELPAMKNPIVLDYARGLVDEEEVRQVLLEEKARLSSFIITAGIKTTDGETGSVGPQVAEALSELLGTTVPHVTYVLDLEVEEEGRGLLVKRRISSYLEHLRMPLPALLTIADEYEPRPVPASKKKAARANYYKGKILEPRIWGCEDIEADITRVGLLGSPTVVGPGYDIAGPPIRKFLGRTLIAKKSVGAFTINGKEYGPFKAGDVVDGVDEKDLKKLLEKGIVGTFDYSDLLKELFGD